MPIDYQLAKIVRKRSAKRASGKCCRKVLESFGSIRRISFDMGQVLNLFYHPIGRLGAGGSRSGKPFA